METAVVTALISASAAISSACIAGSTILYAAKRVIARKSLRLQLIDAYKDILFLSELETAHVEVNVAQHHKSNKNMMRDVIRNEKGLEISGKNTPSAVKRKIDQLSKFDD